jgi:cation diffusion facilitator CzcD-associated flavoprotein CzcO
LSENDYEIGVQRWFSDFESAVAARSREQLEALFPEVSYLRDNGALTWDYLQFHGRNAVVLALLEIADEIQPHDFVLSKRWPRPRVVGEGPDARLEAFADLRTKNALATAFFHASLNDQSPYGFDVFALFTRIEGIQGVEAPVRFPRGIGFEPSRPDEHWHDRRAHDLERADHDPEVLVIGGGQAGLIVTAYLQRNGVDALIIEKNPRIGDNWRNRYDSLYLHNPIEMNDFPFLPFPDHYPEYLPKDVLADWLEIYQRYLDLDVWLSTTFLGAEYREDTHEWTATVRREDGSIRVLHPKHIVHCTGGFGGKWHFPTLPGLSDYQGTVMHSEQYRRASDYTAKRVIVFGVATSGNDVAEDLCKNGFDVTIVQRGPVVVTQLTTANDLVYAGFLDPDQPTELVDIRYSMGWIYPLRVVNAQRSHQRMLEKDAELLEGLEQAGMKLWNGPNGMGWLGLYWTRGGGYYLNKGTSELIIEGKIDLLQSERIVKVVSNGLLLDDGTVLEAELFVFATGYEGRRMEITEQFGKKVAAKLGEVGVLDEMGEWRGFWGQSGQRGLWLNGAGINSARPQSERVALLVKADLEGAIPDSFRRPPVSEVDTRFAQNRVLTA